MKRIPSQEDDEGSGGFSLTDTPKDDSRWSSDEEPAKYNDRSGVDRVNVQG